MSAVRAFVAVGIGAEARARLAAWMGALRPRLPGLKWVEPENLHLTLRFLGETPLSLLPDLERALREAAAAVPPFTLAVRGTGAFPGLARPRVLWAAVEAGAGLAALQRRVEEAVGRLGWPAEDRPFHPHVTLARVREERPRADAAAALGAAAAREWGRTTVDEVLLLRSTLTPRGPIYARLASFPLGGRRATGAAESPSGPP